MRDFGARFTHDSLSRLELINQTLDETREGATADSIELCKQQIALRKDGSNAILTVENEGPPILPELLNGESLVDDSGTKRFGLFFVRQVASGYSGSCQWKNIKQVQGAGANKRSINRVQVVVTLPVMS